MHILTSTLELEPMPAYSQNRSHHTKESDHILSNSIYLDVYEIFAFRMATVNEI
jgi:hypothetical protein